ncbi:CHAT domain-containing protein [Mycena vulgaris]|nr:CHAT domain-containing protein [Mycena vulgaris]
MSMSVTSQSDDGSAFSDGLNFEAFFEDPASPTIDELRRAVVLTAESHPAHVDLLEILGMFLTEKYRRSGDIQDLEAAVENNQAAVAKTLEGDPDLAGRLKNLAISLTDRYRRLGDLKDLEHALRNDQRAVNLTSPGDPDLPGRCHSLAVTFRDKYQALGDLKDLENALENDQTALALMPETHPFYSQFSESLGISFGLRYQRLNNPRDLDTALERFHGAVAQTSQGNPHLPGYLHSLAIGLKDRFKRLGDITDLQAALENCRIAIDLTPKEGPDLPSRSDTLAICLMERYENLGDLKDLEAGLACSESAVAKTAKGNIYLAQYLRTLAIWLRIRYQRLRDPQDLAAALQHNQTVIELTPEGHPDLSRRLETLARCFRMQYLISGNLKDLEGALQTRRKAVQFTPTDHPDLPGNLQSLSVSLYDRYQRFGDLKDLEDALENDQQTIHLTPEGHPDLPGYLQSLAISFTVRYRRSNKVNDLEAAIQNNEAAVAQTPDSHPHLPIRIQSLGTSIIRRYRRSNSVNDLEAAVKHFQKAVSLTENGHPDLPQQLLSLAAAFTDRYHRLGNVDDLETALKNDTAAIDLIPEGHPDLSRGLQNLAMSFTEKYDRLHDLKDLEAAFESYSAAFRIPSIYPVESWMAALRWAALAKLHKPTDCLKAYPAAFELLSQVLWIGNSLAVRQDAMRRINITEAMSRAISACVELSELQFAVVLLEQGLATMFQQLLQLKTTVDILPQAEADKLQLLSAQLYSGTSDDPKRIAAERNELLEKIREHPGLEKFLRPKSFKDLCQAAVDGPVIILNSHSDHCDGIIILDTVSPPVRVLLPAVTTQALEQQQEILQEVIHGRNMRGCEVEGVRLYGRREPSKFNFETLLTWLQSSIIEPVYQTLKSHGIVEGRLWWCPTGHFAGLPLHAADVSDTFIHSYTSTLGALLEANSRKHHIHSPALGIVGVTHTGPQRNQALPGVEQEIKKITSIVGQNNVQTLLGEQATVESVKLQIEKCAWVHLACHAMQNHMDPPKSCLQLYGGNLDLETILRKPLPNAEFIFLAACQTAQGDSELVNESFHLGGGFIAAGFQGAIATMWSMLDNDGPVIADMVYSHLFANGGRPHVKDAAKGLQLAVRKLRDQGVPPSNILYKL